MQPRFQADQTAGPSALYDSSPDVSSGGIAIVVHRQERASDHGTSSKASLVSLQASLRGMLRRTPLAGLYRRVVGPYRMRWAARSFWTWSDEDQKRLEFYRQFLAPGSLVIDVGANLGNRSKVFWKLGASVIAAEPQPACAGFLRSVFAGKPRFTLVEAALGPAPGQAEMMISNAHTVSSLSSEWVRIVRESGRFPGCEWNRTMTVTVDTLDALILRYGLPAFIKIDVEGFEDQVLSGLTQRVPALSVEFTPEFGQGTRRCIEHLARLGDVEFRISLGESMQWALPDWVDSDEVLRVLRDFSTDVFGDIYARFRE